MDNYYSDLEDVIDWAREQAWYREPFVLVGHSLGGMCVALYAELHAKNVLAVAPISPVVSGLLSQEAYNRQGRRIIKDWKESGWLVRKSESRPGIIKRLPWSHMMNRAKYDLLKQVKKLSMPVLLIVGEDDLTTPPDHVMRLFNTLPGSKEIHVIKGATHNLSGATPFREIKKIFLNWIEFSVLKVD